MTEVKKSNKTVNPKPPKQSIFLELGDWVYERGKATQRLSPPMYVVGIWDNGVYLEIDSEQGDPFEADYNDIVPIPLTDEIITNNKLGMYVIKEYGQYKLVINNSHISIHYVHQLQHLLRLYGIDKTILI